MSAELTPSYQCVFWFFQSTCLKSKVLRLPRKSDAVMPGHAKCCTCHAKSSSQNWRFDAPKGKPSQEISAWTLMNMCLVLRLLRKMHLARSSWNVPPLPSVFEMLRNHHVLLAFDKVSNPFRLPRETQSEGPKVARTCNVFNFWLRNVLLATTTCTFSTSQLNVQKRSEPGSFFTLWLRNLLPSSTACTFSTSQLPKVVREWFCTFWLGNVLRATTACYKILFAPNLKEPRIHNNRYLTNDWW